MPKQLQTVGGADCHGRSITEERFVFGLLLQPHEGAVMTKPFRMRLRFWGVRGSIPTPQSENLQFGGNTACVEIRLSGGAVLVLDGGTGIRDLGLLLTREFGERPLNLNLFLTHFHWDHIQGIPFFNPLYSAQNRVTFYGHGALGHPRRMLGRQMQEPYFPVALDLVAATKEFVEVGRSSLTIDAATIHPFPLNHPQGAIGYRVESEGAAIVYATDFEHGNAELDTVLREYSKDADLLIYDAQYTPEEYERHRGWGHSTWLEATRVASDCGVDRLILFHHDPSHDTETTVGIVRQAQARFPNTIAAQEGWTTDL